MPVLYLYAGVKFDVPCGLPAGIGESGRSSPFYVARTYALSASTVLYVRISTDFMVRKVLSRSDICAYAWRGGVTSPLYKPRYSIPCSSLYVTRLTVLCVLDRSTVLLVHVVPGTSFASPCTHLV